MSDQIKEELDDKGLLKLGFSYALSLTHHTHDAEDLVQQAWFKLCRRYGSVKNRALIYTTIRNLFYDKCKRGKIVYFESIDDTETDTVVDEGYESDVSIKGDLDILLAHISPREREVLYLNCVEGYTADEVGKLLDCPRGTILSLLSRAKQKLRKIAKQEGVNRDE